MGPRRSRDVRSALLKKGFKLIEGGKHTHFVLHDGDQPLPVMTLMSHGAGELPSGLLGQMSREVRLTRRQFDQLLDCPLSREAYLRIVRQVLSE